MVSVQERVSAGESEAEAAEKALLRAGRAGDAAALERLLALHQRPLYALCRSMLGHAEDAEDAVQETFLRALRGLARFRGDAAFRTWLFQIAVHLCLDWKASRRASEPFDEERGELAGPAPSPETIALRRVRMTEALRSLLPRHRALILLKVREGWSVAEMARALRWNEKRVENELSRARRALVEWRRSAEEGEER